MCAICFFRCSIIYTTVAAWFQYLLGVQCLLTNAWKSHRSFIFMGPFQSVSESAEVSVSESQ